jgi:hypothetical protein
LITRGQNRPRLTVAIPTSIGSQLVAARRSSRDRRRQ